VIEGVVLKNVVTHNDDRGFFRELVRVDDDFFEEGFGQWGHSLVHVGVAKAWHVHKVQVDWWYVASGLLKVALYDTRADSPTSGKLMELLMGDHQEARVLRVPPGVAHGYKALSEPVHVLYLTSKVYDPSDEGRIPHDDPKIAYDWSKGPAIR
jgi:dTDP-4-dehydrorhamnose 3,5-epimerase